MIGTHIDAVIADAIVKGIEGLDLETAYAGLRKDAMVNPREGDRGRQALDEYLKRGYVPDGRCEYATSAGLDYAYDDWCVAQAARKLGKMDDYRLLMERAKKLSQVVGPERRIHACPESGRPVGRKVRRVRLGRALRRRRTLAMFLGGATRSGRPDRSRRRSESHGRQARQDDDHGIRPITWEAMAA